MWSRCRAADKVGRHPQKQMENPFPPHEGPQTILRYASIGRLPRKDGIPGQTETF